MITAEDIAEFARRHPEELRDLLVAAAAVALMDADVELLRDKVRKVRGLADRDRMRRDERRRESQK